MNSFLRISGGSEEYYILYRIIEQCIIFPLIFYVIDTYAGGRQMCDVRFLIWCHLNYMALFDVGLNLAPFQPGFNDGRIISELMGCTTFVFIFACFSFGSSILINYWKCDQYIIFFCISAMIMVVA